MAMKSVLFLLLIAVALSSAQQKCCFPDQYEAEDGEIIGTVQSGQGTAQTLGVQFAFDYPNRRVGELFKMTGMNYQAVLNYNTGSYYVVNLSTKTCQKLPLPSKTMVHCIPSNATFSGSFLAGYGSNSLMADTFSISVNTASAVGNLTLSVAKGSCIPFSQAFIGTSSGAPMINLQGFVNYTPGIKNPSMYFNVPSYCPSFFTMEPKEEFEALKKVLSWTLLL